MITNNNVLPKDSLTRQSSLSLLVWTTPLNPTVSFLVLSRSQSTRLTFAYRHKKLNLPFVYYKIPVKRMFTSFRSKCLHFRCILFQFWHKWIRKERPKKGIQLIIHNSPVKDLVKVEYLRNLFFGSHNVTMEKVSNFSIFSIYWLVFRFSK